MSRPRPPNQPPHPPTPRPQIKDLCAILCGLVVAQDFKRGQKLVADRSFADLCQFFQDCFEAGRRHKIMNPEKVGRAGGWGGGVHS